MAGIRRVRPLPRFDELPRALLELRRPPVAGLLEHDGHELLAAVARAHGVLAAATAANDGLTLDDNNATS